MRETQSVCAHAYIHNLYALDLNDIKLDLVLLFRKMSLSYCLLRRMLYRCFFLFCFKYPKYIFNICLYLKICFGRIKFPLRLQRVVEFSEKHICVHILLLIHIYGYVLFTHIICPEIIFILNTYDIKRHNFVLRNVNYLFSEFEIIFTGNK